MTVIAYQAWRSIKNSIQIWPWRSQHYNGTQMCQSAIITELSVCGIRGSLIISCHRCMEHICNSRRFQSNRYRPSINSSSPLVRHFWSFTASECGLVVASTGFGYCWLVASIITLALSWSVVRTPPMVDVYRIIPLGVAGGGWGRTFCGHILVSEK